MRHDRAKQRRGVQPPFFIIAQHLPPPPLASSPQSTLFLIPSSLILPLPTETFGPWTWIDPGAFALVREGGGGGEGRGWAWGGLLLVGGRAGGLMRGVGGGAFALVQRAEGEGGGSGPWRW